MFNFVFYVLKPFHMQPWMKHFASKFFKQKWVVQEIQKIIRFPISLQTCLRYNEFTDLSVAWASIQINSILSDSKRISNWSNTNSACCLFSQVRLKSWSEILQFRLYRLKNRGNPFASFLLHETAKGTEYHGWNNRKAKSLLLLLISVKRTCKLPKDWL